MSSVVSSTASVVHLGELRQAGRVALLHVGASTHDDPPTDLDAVKIQTAVRDGSAVVVCDFSRFAETFRVILDPALAALVGAQLTDAALAALRATEARTAASARA
jgi:hypothetical protein